MARPSFNAAWNAFMRVNVKVADVGKIIGGKVDVNIKIPEDKGGFANACPIRMSYVLNKTGFPIRRNIARYPAVSGADGMWYIYHVNEMMLYLEDTFGEPDKKVKRSPKYSDFHGMKGIIVVKGSGWNNARGHVALWNGTRCSDTCHLPGDDNGSFTASEAALWVLP
jgi:hypothetical protein